MSPRPRRSRLILVLGGLLVVILVIVGINARLAMRPEAVEARVRSELEKRLRVPFEIGSAELSFSDGVLLRDLRIFEAPGRDGQKRTLLDFPRTRIVPDYGSLLFGTFKPVLIVFEGAEMDVSISADGTLNLSELVRDGPSLSPDSLPPLPDVRVRGMKVNFADKRSELAVAADDVELFLRTSKEGEILLNSSFRLEGGARVEAEGRLAGGIASIRDGSLEANFKVYHFEPRGQLAPLLAHLEISKVLKERSFSGGIDLDGDLVYERESGLRINRATASLAGCELVLPGFERKLRMTAGSAEFLGDRIRLQDARGELAGGILSASGSIGLDTAEGSVSTLQGSLKVESLSVDGELLNSLAPEINKAYPGIDIRGRLGLACEISRELKFPPDLEDLDASVELSDIRIVHKELTFPVDKLAGIVELDKGVLKTGEPLTGKWGGASLAVSELNYAVAGDGSFQAVIDIGGKEPAECLALDGRLRGILGELGEDAVKIWDSLEPEGQVALKAKVVAGPAPAAGEKRPAPSVILSAYPRDLKIRYRLFPYVIEKIGGEAFYDSSRPYSGVTLKLDGLHGEQKIVCDGSIKWLAPPTEDAGKPSGLKLDISCDHLEYDKDLRAAIQPDVSRMIDTFAFKGVVKADVGISSQLSGKPKVKVVLDLVKGEIQPVDFPYRLPLATGRVIVADSEKVQFSGFKTAEGPGAQISFDGILRTLSDSRKLEYRFLLDDFELDKDFRQAVPSRFQNLMSRLGLQGTFSGRLSGWYLKDLKDSTNDKTYFEGTDVKTRNAAVNFGVKVSEMDAQGRFTGGHDKDRPNYFWGEVKVDKARFNRLQLRDGDIVFSFGEMHDRIRRLAESVETPTEKGPYLSSSIISRLARGDVTDTFQMSIVSNNFYKGRLDGMLYVDTGDKMGDLGGEFAASGIQLSEASEDVFELQKGQASGDAHGKVFFAGKTGDQRSIRGEGFGAIKDGDLAQLPLLLGIFKLFKLPDLANLGFSDLLSRSKLDNLRIPYTIEDGRFLTEELELKSSNSALSFSGTGSMDFNGNLALELEPQLSPTRLKVPIIPDLIDLTGIKIGDILSFIKKGILKIKVGGDIAKPRVELATGLGLIKVPLDSQKPEKPQKKDDSGGEKPPAGKSPGRD